MLGDVGLLFIGGTCLGVFGELGFGFGGVFS